MIPPLTISSERYLKKFVKSIWNCSKYDLNTIAGLVFEIHFYPNAQSPFSILLMLLKIFTSQGIDVPAIEAVLDATPTILNAEARSDMSRPFTSEERQWDHTTLQSNFYQGDIDRICTIPRNLFPSDDILIWHHSSTSCYNVKTAFWSLILPSKVHIFSWKVFHEVLPVAAVLCKRHITDDPKCLLYHNQLETINHALFWCNRAQAVWNQTDLVLDFHLSSSMSIQDYLVHVSTKLSKDQLEQFKIILWCIWFERNAETHEKKAKTAALLLRFATSYLTDYKKANTNWITASHATQS
ncbi:hypothetical protein F8388_024164 [Cannabis sativa]|uniref:Reverse transcriptase zinc-binding domain-containing protein n=1 Tax=Cannabis sativa TaxID=3483 RepID=A0A7J6FXS8_CANSA|nr:hypothetical protein F8388_024164 [Cannabis sativa]